MNEPRQYSMFKRLLRWFDNGIEPDSAVLKVGQNHVDWVRVIPFALLHLACLAVIWVDWSVFAVAVAVFLYGIRMFAITGFYHRYFSHKAFRTSRPVQFIFAVLGASPCCIG